MFIRLVLRAPFIAVGAIVMAMLIDLKLSLIFVAAALVIAILLAIIMLTTMPKYKDVQAKLDDVSRLTKENLSGARVVRAFGAEGREKTVFDKAAQSLSQTSIKVSAVSSLLNPLTYAVLNLAIIAILYFGGKRRVYGQPHARRNHRACQLHDANSQRAHRVCKLAGDFHKSVRIRRKNQRGV